MTIDPSLKITCSCLAATTEYLTLFCDFCMLFTPSLSMDFLSISILAADGTPTELPPKEG